MTSPLFEDEPNADLSREPVEDKARQKRYLPRELARFEDYFQRNGHELGAREDREYRKKSRMLPRERIEPTLVQPWRCRADQIDAIREIPHLGALVVIAKSAQRHAGREDKRAGALFPSRSKRWSFVTEG